MLSYETISNDWDFKERSCGGKICRPTNRDAKCGLAFQKHFFDNRFTVFSESLTSYFYPIENIVFYCFEIIFERSGLQRTLVVDNFFRLTNHGAKYGFAFQKHHFRLQDFWSHAVTWTPVAQFRLIVWLFEPSVVGSMPWRALPQHIKSTWRQVDYCQ